MKSQSKYAVHAASVDVASGAAVEVAVVYCLAARDNVGTRAVDTFAFNNSYATRGRSEVPAEDVKALYRSIQSRGCHFPSPSWFPFGTKSLNSTLNPGPAAGSGGGRGGGTGG